MDGTGQGLYPVAAFVIGSVEYFSLILKELVNWVFLKN
jgi:hypothetical protein